MQRELDFTAIEQKALAALRTRLGVRSKDLPRAMKSAGRRLPREAHRAAQVLGEAKVHSAHPKLARMVDHGAVDAAEQTLHAHLEKIDPKERRTDMILAMLGTQALNVLAVIALVVGLMWWRGLL
ncbi:hypothetical protein [Planktotalea sp.]|uniref:hypothetical protein n=1 Tax=Planktotalea sp. TaxID=2029877 RepID=UPI003D6B79FB